LALLGFIERCDIRENIYAGSNGENINKYFFDVFIKRDREKSIATAIAICDPLLAGGFK
jgi:hypothetical protein